MTTNAEHHRWLDLTVEEALEPNLPICDPHHHFWDRLNDRYFLDDLYRDLGGGHNIVSTVFIECQAMYRQDGPEEMKTLGQTEFVQGLIAQNASGQYGDTNVAAGVVAFADLALGGEVERVLEAHQSITDRFRGVRQITAFDASPDVPRPRPFPEGLLGDANFREGFAALDKLGLSFDAYLYHLQLPEVADLANAFPGVTIILNHVGGLMRIGPYANKDDEVLSEWRSGLATVADCPNVVVKLGGLGMPRAGFDWHTRDIPVGSEELAADIAPIMNYCIDQFGPDRCMFESNFPPDKMSFSYNVMYNAFKRLSQSYSTTERAAMFHDTAARVYRIDV